MKTKKPQRSIYRVLPIVEHHKKTRHLIGWQVKGPSGYTASFLHSSSGTKRQAVKLARSLAKENQPSQVLVSRKSRATGQYRIKIESSYGCDSQARR